MEKILISDAKNDKLQGNEGMNQFLKYFSLLGDAYGIMLVIIVSYIVFRRTDAIVITV